MPEFDENWRGYYDTITEDCKTAVIPKEEILNAIYHSYQDKWLPLSKGEDKNKGAANCALCQLMKRYDIGISPFFRKGAEKLCTTECPIAIDSEQCDNQRSLYKEYTNSIAWNGLAHSQTLRAADRFAYYLLDLYARVNQDKVNLPYLADVVYIKRNYGEWNIRGKPAGKPEPVEKKKEWRVVATERISIQQFNYGDNFRVYFNVDGGRVGQFPVRGENAHISERYRDKFKINMRGDGSYDTLMCIYEYI